MDKNWIALISQQNQLQNVIKTNQYTEKFGLTLTEQDAKMIIERKKDTLKAQRRVEFGPGIVTKIIHEFCDSTFINQNNYAETIARLQDIFFLYKNETMDEMTDEELLHLMSQMYENICFGDLNYLEEKCLADFAEAIREGYRGYISNNGYGEYSKFDDVTRWDFDLFMQALNDLND